MAFYNHIVIRYIVDIEAEYGGIANGIRIPKRHSDRGVTFRPTRLVETLNEYSDAAGASVEYLVVLSGPEQTAAGRDHARRKGEMAWCENELDGDPEGTTAMFPPLLLPLLIGPQQLRKYCQEGEL